MKILLVGNYKPYGQLSMLKFADVLQQELVKGGHDVKLIRPEPFLGKLEFLPRPLLKWLRSMDTFLLFIPRLRRLARWADVVHVCDHSNAFYSRCIRNIPHVVTCHDVLAIRSALGEFPGQRLGKTGNWRQRLILNGLEHSMMVACDTETTRAELLRISEISPDAAEVVHIGLNYPYSALSLEEAENRLTALGINPERPFLFHIGGNHWYKNRNGVIEIFRHFLAHDGAKDFSLVMAGPPFSLEMRQKVQCHNLDNKVVEIVNPENEDVRALYSRAAALLFPSLFEGFGWPIIEAQACGCVVFTSHRSAMTEVGRDSVVYIDPDNPEEAAKILNSWISDDDKMSSARDAGYRNTLRFSTDRMIADYCNLYDKVCR